MEIADAVEPKQLCGFNAEWLRGEILKGESRGRQFRPVVENPCVLASDAVALLNSGGGQILVGILTNGTTRGLSTTQVAATNRIATEVCCEYIQPPVSLITTNVLTPDGIVVVITVDEGVNGPYQTIEGEFWVRSGAGKRRVKSCSEIMRMFQSEGQLYAEQRTVPGTSLASLDIEAYASFYTEKYPTKTVPADHALLERELTASRLMENGLLTTAGVLLFCRQPERLVPAFCVKAVWYKGNDRAGTEFRVSDKFDGALQEQYEKGMAFLRRWNSRVPDGGSFNTSRPEIPEYVFEDLLTNALVHRDYFIDDSVKLFIFDDRIEIRSPGRLPNSLTVEAIRHGIRRDRNPVLVSFAYDVMNYRGLGSGMLRVLAAIPNLEIQNDVEAEEVTVTIPLAVGQAPAQGTGE